MIAIFGVFLCLVSAMNQRVYEAADGYKAPALSFTSNDTCVSLTALRGNYVLLNFWASSDAQSRLAAAEYDKLSQTSSLEGKRFCLLSVNLDRSERLFREIVRRDNLSAEKHFYVTGDEASRISADYHLAGGLRAFLVDPQGRIVAVNPSSSTLTQVLSN